MKLKIKLAAAALLLMASFNSQAQISIARDTIKIKALEEKEKKEKKKFNSQLTMDLGWNMLIDNTNYNSPEVANYLHVSADKRNSALLGLRQNKSINANINWLYTFKAVRKEGQKVLIASGLGLQLYNFRFDNNITFAKGSGGVSIDTLSFTKNKLAFDYLNVPLLITSKTRIYNNKENHKKDRWLVYGVGASAGYSLSTWTKQISGQKGKVKVHDAFEFNPFNACVSAEIGIEDVLRFYVNYQVTNIFKESGSNVSGMEMHPLSFGFKLSGI